MRCPWTHGPLSMFVTQTWAVWTPAWNLESCKTGPKPQALFLKPNTSICSDIVAMLHSSLTSFLIYIMKSNQEMKLQSQHVTIMENSDWFDCRKTCSANAINFCNSNLATRWDAPFPFEAKLDWDLCVWSSHHLRIIRIQWSHYSSIMDRKIHFL